MIDLKNYGFDPDILPPDANGIPARITAVFKERYEIICEHDSKYARLKSSVYYGSGQEDFPTTGDFVLINYINSGDSIIIKTLPRKSKFARNDFSGHGVAYVKTVIEQIVAANFDYVFIMASINYNLNIRRIERYLSLAWQSGAIPIVILNKADLVTDHTKYVNAVEEAAIGVDVIAISAKTGYGLDKLTKYLNPKKTIVFLGSSGVGKSSLVNILAQDEIMTVKAIREDDSMGRHTTTHRQLIMLNNGVMIIDTPGMRELGMWDVDTGLSDTFIDIEQLLDNCKFTNCKHTSEPDCAIKNAIASGELSQGRWDNYLQLRKEAKFADRKAKYTALRQQKNIALVKSKKLRKLIAEEISNE